MRCDTDLGRGPSFLLRCFQEERQGDGEDEWNANSVENDRRIAPLPDGSFRLSIEQRVRGPQESHLHHVTILTDLLPQDHDTLDVPIDSEPRIQAPLALLPAAARHSPAIHACERVIDVSLRITRLAVIRTIPRYVRKASRQPFDPYGVVLAAQFGSLDVAPGYDRCSSSEVLEKEGHLIARFELPVGVNTAEIKAGFQNGVLELVVPLPTAAVAGPAPSRDCGA